MDSSNLAQRPELRNAPAHSLEASAPSLVFPKAPRPAIDQIPPIVSLPPATPVFLTKGLQFPIQPVKIMNSEPPFAIDLVSGHLVHGKELGERTIDSKRLCVVPP